MELQNFQLFCSKLGFSVSKRVEYWLPGLVFCELRVWADATAAPFSAKQEFVLYFCFIFYHADLDKLIVLFIQVKIDGCDDYFPRWSKLIKLCDFSLDCGESKPVFWSIFFIFLICFFFFIFNCFGGYGSDDYFPKRTTLIKPSDLFLFWENPSQESDPFFCF